MRDEGNKEGRKGRKGKGAVALLLQTVDKMSQIPSLIPTGIWICVVIVLTDL